MSQTAQTQLAAPSPCIGVCKLDLTSQCIGCGRLLSEIAAWSRMTVEEQRRVCQRAAERLKTVDVA